ncbi:uncharacterized protein LOC131941596 [Physella acuta]|uniref:uncharacterized protein LOC131929091 n=1 Tax=Physella acuta TaxID=109671 RepID=UPI0027DAFFDE|nr:uncharacterized protein LOC131929091 [Physella acuta]XP_059156895.1 uncharacterized protein LOC131941596 [Physella acuta]
MASGIKIDDSVKKAWAGCSMMSVKSKKLKYAVFKFSDDVKKVEVEKTGSTDDGEPCEYDVVIGSLPADDVRYLAYDFDFCNKDGTKKSEMILVSWHPESCSVRKKMICASSFNALKSALSVSKNVIEGDNYSEVDTKAVLEKLGWKAA